MGLIVRQHNRQSGSFRSPWYLPVTIDKTCDVIVFYRRNHQNICEVVEQCRVNSDDNSCFNKKSQETSFNFEVAANFK